MVTQFQIAKEAKVARTTVSAILNNRPGLQISSETKQRVWDAIQQLGYRTHRYARITRGGRSNLIGIIQTAPGIQTGLERILYAGQAIQQAGYAIQTTELFHEQGMKLAVDTLLDACVEGVLLIGLSPGFHKMEAHLLRIRQAGLPIVALASYDWPMAPWFSTVQIDTYQGMHDLTQHVLRLGYRRLAFLAPEGFEGAARAQAFRETLAKAPNRPIGEEVYTPVANYSFPDYHLTGQQGMERILARPGRPQIVLCANDYLALGALRACTEAGVRVPDDLAITGFDNCAFGKYTTPALTSVAQPNEISAIRAVERLVKLIRSPGPVTGEKQIKLPCQVVVRESCGRGDGSSTLSSSTL